MKKKVLITKIVLTCVAAVIFVVFFSILLAAPESRAYSKYYIYENSYTSEQVQEANRRIDEQNEQDRQDAEENGSESFVPKEKYLDFEKVEVYLGKDGFYSVLTMRDGTTETSDKVPFFVRNGRIFLDTTKDEYDALTNTKKSAVVSHSISGYSLSYYAPGSIQSSESTDIVDFYYSTSNGFDNLVHASIPFAIVGFLLFIFSGLSLISEIRENKKAKKPAEQEVAEKPKKPRITFKSIQDKVTKKVLVALAAVTVVSFVVGAVLASGKYSTHMGTYTISDEELPKSVKESGKQNFKIHFTKDGVVETYETVDHYVLSEPTKYLVKGGRLYLGITEEEYREIVDGLKELDATKDEQKEMLELMAEDISTLKYKTYVLGQKDPLVFKSSAGVALEVIGYILLGIGGLAFIELLVSLSQKFVYVLVLKRAPIPAGFGENTAEGGNLSSENSEQVPESVSEPAEQASDSVEAETEPASDAEVKKEETEE